LSFHLKNKKKKNIIFFINNFYNFFIKNKLLLFISVLNFH
jgi:hypothetical protein